MNSLTTCWILLLLSFLFESLKSIYLFSSYFSFFMDYWLCIPLFLVTDTTYTGSYSSLSCFCLLLNLSYGMKSSSSLLNVILALSLYWKRLGNFWVWILLLNLTLLWSGKALIMLLLPEVELTWNLVRSVMGKEVGLSAPEWLMSGLTDILLIKQSINYYLPNKIWPYFYWFFSHLLRMIPILYILRSYKTYDRTGQHFGEGPQHHLPPTSPAQENR